MSVEREILKETIIFEDILEYRKYSDAWEQYNIMRRKTKSAKISTFIILYLLFIHNNVCTMTELIKTNSGVNNNN